MRASMQKTRRGLGWRRELWVAGSVRFKGASLDLILIRRLKYVCGVRSMGAM